MVFRFGNGMAERATQVATLPLGIAQTYGTVDAAVINLSAPLLLGRPSLVKMGASLDFQTNNMKFLGTRAELKTDTAGQLLVDVSNYPAKPACPPKPEATVGNSESLGTSQSRSPGRVPNLHSSRWMGTSEPLLQISSRNSHAAQDIKRAGAF